MCDSPLPTDVDLMHSKDMHVATLYRLVCEGVSIKGQTHQEESWMANCDREQQEGKEGGVRSFAGTVAD